MSLEVTPRAAPAESSLSSVGSGVGASDPATALLALMLQSRGVQGDVARADIDHAYDLLESARKQIREAMEEAAEAQRNAGFWDDVSNLLGGDIATIASVVAAAALVVGTGGAGAPAILALVGAGMSVGAAVGEKLGLDPKLCAILAAGGAVAGIVGGNVKAPAGLWASVAKGAALTQAGAKAGGGGAGIAAGGYRADVLDAQSDTVRARDLQEAATLRFDRALGTLEQIMRDLQRGERVATDSVSRENDGQSALISRVGAA